MSIRLSKLLSLMLTACHNRPEDLRLLKLEAMYYHRKGGTLDPNITADEGDFEQEAIVYARRQGLTPESITMQDIQNFLTGEMNAPEDAERVYTHPTWGEDFTFHGMPSLNSDSDVYASHVAQHLRKMKYVIPREKANSPKIFLPGNITKAMADLGYPKTHRTLFTKAIYSLVQGSPDLFEIQGTLAGAAHRANDAMAQRENVLTQRTERIEHEKKIREAQAMARLAKESQETKTAMEEVVARYTPGTTPAKPLKFFLNASKIRVEVDNSKGTQIDSRFAKGYFKFIHSTISKYINPPKSGKVSLMAELFRRYCNENHPSSAVGKLAGSMVITIKDPTIDFANTYAGFTLNKKDKDGADNFLKKSWPYFSMLHSVAVIIGHGEDKKKHYRIENGQGFIRAPTYADMKAALGY